MIIDGEVQEVVEINPDKNNPLMEGVVTKLPKITLFNKKIN